MHSQHTVSSSSSKVRPRSISPVTPASAVISEAQVSDISTDSASSEGSAGPEQTVTPGSRTTGSARAYLDLTLAMLLVGSSVVAAKYTTQALPVYLAQWLRFCVATVIMLPLLLRREGGLPRLPLHDWAVLFLQAGCGGYLFNVLLLAGLRYTDAMSAGIIASTGPACAALAAWVLLRERPGYRQLAGIVLAVAGVACLNVQTGQVGASGMPGGAGMGVWLGGTMLVVAAVLAESLFLLLGKVMRVRISAMATATMLCVFGAVQFAPQGLVELAAYGVGDIDSVGWLVIGWYGAGITVAAYLFWFRGVAQVPAGEAGIFTAVMPVSAMLLSVTILGESLTWPHVAGCAAVLASIWLVTRGRRAE